MHVSFEVSKTQKTHSFRMFHSAYLTRVILTLLLLVEAKPYSIHRISNSRRTSPDLQTYSRFAALSKSRLHSVPRNQLHNSSADSEGDVILLRDSSSRSLIEESVGEIAIDLADDCIDDLITDIYQEGKKSTVVVDTKQLSQAAKEFKSEFSRYKFLRDFLEVVPSKKALPFAGDVSWTDMHPVMALCLGFRSRDGKVRQDETVEPLGWTGLNEVPDLSDLSGSENQFTSRMTADLPEDEGATDIVIETLAGLEMYSKMKASPDSEVQRRILVGKWLYVQGFFDDQFPALQRFVPAHMMGRDDDDEDDDE